MPVSNPSYFPPQSSGDSIVGINAGQRSVTQRSFLAGASAGEGGTFTDVIVIGHDDFSAGVTDVNAIGSVVIGSQSMQDVLSFTGNDSSANSVNGPSVILGPAIFSAATLLPSTVAIGANIATTLAPSNAFNIGANVIIGIGAFNGLAGVAALDFEHTIAIGFDVFGSSTASGYFSNVVIGSKACLEASPGVDVAENVVIGCFAATQLGSQANVLIGDSACPNLSTGNFNVVIGHAADCFVAASNNVVVGASALAGGSNNNVLLGFGVEVATGSEGGCVYAGYNIGPSGALGGSYNIILGCEAGTLLGGTDSGIFNVEYIDQNSQTLQTMIWADMIHGNMVLGNNQTATIRGFTNAKNCLKLSTGQKSSSNPTGGGYFYVKSDNTLHWVSINGTDTQLAPA